MTSGADSTVEFTNRLDPAAIERAARPLPDLNALGATLVLAPHPDDESLGCGGTLAQLRALGYPVHVLFVSDGTLSHPNSPSYPADRLRTLRETEALEALRILNIPPENAYFMRQKDRHVATPDQPQFPATLHYVVNLLNQLRPASVLVPWRRDPHPDHRASWQLVSAAVEQLAEPRPRVLEYLIWLWELAHEADLPRADEVRVWRVGIADVFEQRARAIAAHRSQVTRLIDDDPTAFYLLPKLLTHFAQPRELFLESR